MQMMKSLHLLELQESLDEMTEFSRYYQRVRERLSKLKEENNLAFFYLQLPKKSMLQSACFFLHLREIPANSSIPRAKLIF